MPASTVHQLALDGVRQLPGAHTSGWVPVGLSRVATLTTASPTRLSVELVIVDAVLLIAVLLSLARAPTTHERS